MRWASPEFSAARIPRSVRTRRRSRSSARRLSRGGSAARRRSSACTAHREARRRAGSPGSSRRISFRSRSRAPAASCASTPARRSRASSIGIRTRARDGLVGFGLQEIVSYSLIDPAWLKQLTADGSAIAPEPLRVVNPTTVSQSAARPTLRASLLDTARRNLRHRASVAIFEIAPIYLPRRADLPVERWTVGVLLSGNAQPVKDGETWLVPERRFDVRDLQGIVSGLAELVDVQIPGERVDAPGLHSGRSVARGRDGTTHLILGQLDPRVAETWGVPVETFLAEIDLASWHEASRTPRVVTPARFPAALRDLAIVVDEATSYGDVEREIRAASGKDLESVALLDLYRGPQAGAGKKSFAVRLVFRSGAGTLGEADVDRLVKRITGRLQHALGATIRD